ncbi:MAG: hypothetical protein AAFZ15_11840 [Bacteroidota bacterium]
MPANIDTIISPLDTALKNYQEELGKRIKTATSDKNAKDRGYQSALDQLQNKTCSYLKLRAIKELYRNLDQCISITAHKESELVKTNVADMIKGSEALKEQLAKLSKTLKKVKTEVYGVKEIACNLVDCCLDKDRQFNKSVYNELCSIGGFEDTLKEIKEKATKSYEMADLTFCAAVNVSGIQGFASIDSLKGYSERLVTTQEELKKNVEENCSELKAGIETSIKERTELVVKVAVSKYLSYDAKCEESALCSTWNTSSNPCPGTPEDGKKRLNEICEKFKDDLVAAPPANTPPLKNVKGSNTPQF